MLFNMSSDKNYDELLFPILCNEETIYGFFDRIFDFLYRKTDFFKLRGVDSEEFGLDIGEAEKIVRSIFCKYMQEASDKRGSSQTCENIPLDCVSEETVVTTTEPEELPEDKGGSVSSSEMSSQEEKPTHRQTEVLLMDSDSYNGASHEGYSWSQSIKDLDVRIQVPKEVGSGKQVRVEITQSSLKIEQMRGEDWSTIKEGDFSWPINVEGSTWTLVPNEHIHVYLSKLNERWWGCVLTGEPQIDLTRIDSSVPYEELDEDSRTKIQELMHHEHLKRTTGRRHLLAPQHREMEGILKDAWNREGSPFKGRPFDPSILDLQGVSMKKDLTPPV